MKTKLAILTLCAMIVSACGTLNVQVEVLDPAYLEEVKAKTIDPDNLLSELVVTLSQSESVVRDAIDQIEQAHIETLLQYAVRYRNIAAKFRLKAAEPSLLSNEERENLLISAQTYELSANSLDTPQFIEEEIGPIYTKAFKDISELNASVGTAFNDLDPQTRTRILGGQDRIGGRLSSLLQDRRDTINALVRRLQDELGKQGDVAIAQFKNATQLTPEQRQSAVASVIEAKAQGDVVIAATSQTLIGETGVFLSSDPLAFAVANAPVDRWARFYNKAIAEGYLGNVNVAIKLAATGNFTIKGVTFDPSTVAQVASKVTTQAVIMAAQIAGVPISTANASGTGAALAKSSGRLAEAQQRAAAIESVQKDFDSALIDIALAIVQERARLAADQSRVQAIATISAAFEAQKDRLVLTVPSSN